MHVIFCVQWMGFRHISNLEQWWHFMFNTIRRWIINWDDIRCGVLHCAFSLRQLDLFKQYWVLHSRLKLRWRKRGAKPLDGTEYESRFSWCNKWDIVYMLVWVRTPNWTVPNPNWGSAYVIWTKLDQTIGSGSGSEKRRPELNRTEHRQH
jgi:hypothetical protein